MTADPPLSDDPRAIRSVAVTVDDVVTALEARTRAGRETVLRITPPFPARARARLHLVADGGPDDAPDAGSIHLDPRELVDETLPDYPEVDDTADRLESGSESASGGEVDRDRLHDAHAEAVADWRSRVRDHVVDRVELPVGAGPDAPGGGAEGDRSHTVAVKRLG
jgi:hypothetical protein